MITQAPSPNAGVPEKRHSAAFQRQLNAMMALRGAGDMIGHALLAERLGIAERTLRSYLGAERDIPARILRKAAEVLWERSEEIKARAVRLTALGNGH